MIRYVFDMERGQLRPAKENDSQTLPASWEVLLMDEKEFSSNNLSFSFTPVPSAFSSLENGKCF